MNYQKLYSAICKLEGKKVQVSKANVSEVIKCLIEVEAEARAKKMKRKHGPLHHWTMSPIFLTLSKRAGLLAIKKAKAKKNK